LHPDDLLVDIGSQDAIIPSNHHRDTKIGDGQIKRQGAALAIPYFAEGKVTL